MVIIVKGKKKRKKKAHPYNLKEGHSQGKGASARIKKKRSPLLRENPPSHHQLKTARKKKIPVPNEQRVKMPSRS